MPQAIDAGAAVRPWFGVIKVWAMNGEVRSSLTCELKIPQSRGTLVVPKGTLSKQVPPLIHGPMFLLNKSLDLPNLPRYRHKRLMIADGAQGSGASGLGMWWNARDPTT